MTSPFRSSEQRGTYTLKRPCSEDDIITMAQRLLRKRFRRGKSITSPAETRDYLQVTLANREYEVFCALYLDTRHRILSFEELFRGTIDGASVHPREVVKSALQQNAAAVILVHNHPSGNPEPSRADQHITQRLKNALSLVDVRVLDHIIVGGTELVSMAEQGQI